MSGTLCDKRIPIKLIAKCYKTVVRPAKMYGSERRTIDWKIKQSICVK